MSLLKSTRLQNNNLYYKILYMKTRVISFANNKGGSGKTTTCSNVAYCLAERGNRVLMIDCDMQMNLSLSFLNEDRVMAYDAGENNVFHMISDKRDVHDLIVTSPYEGLDIVPSSIRLSEIEESLYGMGGDTDILSGCLKKLTGKKAYDYILLDVPPTLGLWVRNILRATDYVVIPVEASPWGLFGLANMVSYIGNVRGGRKTPEILGIVLTKVNVRKNYYKDTKEFLSDMKDIRIFDTVIRVDSNIEWAQDNSKPVCAYRKGARSAMEYEDLTDEIIRCMGS